MNAQNPVQVYTALFDIKRESIDGRSIGEYIIWLKKTGGLFENLIIFHDGCLKNIQMPNTTLIEIEKRSLTFMAFETALESVLNKFSPTAPYDITFRLAKYGLMQLTKFELGLKLVGITNAKSFLWVDAGISRFIMKTQSNKLLKNSELLISKGYNIAIEIDFFNNYKLKHGLNESKIGSSRRVVSGTSFWLNASFAEKLFNLTLNKSLEWIRLGIWDNEQVMLRNLEIWKNEKTLLINQWKFPTGQVANQLSNSNLLLLEFQSKIYNQLI